MRPSWFRSCLHLAIATVLCAALVLGFPTAVRAYNAPELLPDRPTNIIDLGKMIGQYQYEKLNAELSEFERATGWKLRVLTQEDLTPGRAVKEFWGLDERSVMLVADTRGRNLLNFNVGDAVYDLLPRVFWIELQSRYGNQFFVRDRGAEGAILASLEAIETCLQREGGCAVVPGLPQEQWVLTLITSIAGGFVFGYAGHPRKEGEVFAWKWALILTPLWGMLLVAFGIGPVISRTTDFLPIVRNLAGFVGAAIVAYLIPTPQRPDATAKELP